MNMGDERVRADGGDYEIDETVELEGDSNFKYHVWDIDADPAAGETYSLYVISRDGVSVRSHVLPADEVEFFEEAQVVWTKHQSGYGERLSEEVEIAESDDDPYPASADYVLAVATDRAGDRSPTVTVKLRRNRPEGSEDEPASATETGAGSATETGTETGAGSESGTGSGSGTGAE